MVKVMFYDNDEDVFFGDFSRSATYTPAGGQASAIDVIYDAPGNVITMPGGVAIQVVNHQAVVKDTDVTSPANGDTLIIGGTTYYVRGFTPDGTGFTTLILSTV